MSEFSIMQEGIKKESNRLQEVKNAIGSIKTSVSGVQDGLNSIGLGTLVETIDSLQQRLGKRVDDCNNLSESLNRIVMRYLVCESNVVNDDNELKGAGYKNGDGDLPYVDDEKVPSYGGDQGSPHAWMGIDYKQYQELLDVVRYNISRGYLPEMTPAELDRFLRNLNAEGCGYVAMVNSLFENYSLDEIRQMIGITMTSDDINLYYNKILIDLYCKEDNHIFWADEDVIDSSEDTWGPSGITPENMAYRWEQYCEKYHIDVTIDTYYGLENDDIKKYSNSGTVSVLCEGFTIKDSTGAVIEHYDGSHYMTVLEINSKGEMVVSSWGKVYTIVPDQPRNELNFQVIQYD